jgi:hypothetical protein
MPQTAILSIDEVAKSLGLNIMLTTVPSWGPEKYRLSPDKHRRTVAEIAGYAPIGWVLSQGYLLQAAGPDQRPRTVGWRL